MSFDISVIIPAHHEGRLAHHTMRSLFRAARHADKRSVETEIIIVMDRPDKKTREYFDRYINSGIKIYTVDFGDPGLARNYGVNKSSGKYISFLDADNLFGLNWIYESVKYIEKKDSGVIAHPEYHIIFGMFNYAWKQVSSNSLKFKVENLIEENYWDTSLTSKKELLCKYPFEATTVACGFGFEDWHHSCETLADGIEHHVVPGTVHFMRKKKAGSHLDMSTHSNLLMRPTRLFNPALFSSMLNVAQVKGM